MDFPKKVVWTELAASDYEKVLEYLDGNWSTKIVKEFVATTAEAIDLISQFPKMFMIINRGKRIRRCVLTKHNSLYYKDKRFQIEILRMTDNRTNPKNLKL